MVDFNKKESCTHPRLFIISWWPTQLRRLRLTGRWLAGLVLGWGLGVALSLAQAPRAVPALTAHVIDTMGTLNAAKWQQLERKLSAFEQSRGTQIAVLKVPTTQLEDIFSYANRVANGWEIGRKEIGEGAILDLAAKIVIDEAISPH